MRKYLKIRTTIVTYVYNQAKDKCFLTATCKSLSVLKKNSRGVIIQTSCRLSFAGNVSLDPLRY